MADVVYKVVIDLSTKGDLAAGAGQALPKLGAANDIISKIAANASSMGSVVGSALSGVGAAMGDVIQRASGVAASFVKIGAVAVFGALTYGVIGVNNELEKTQIALGAIFNANGVASSIPAGMGIAKDVMAQMRRDAAALPGEFQDLVGIFKTIAIPGLHGGAGVDELRKLSANTMAVGAITGLPMQQTARELAMLMEGRAGAHNVLGMRLAGLSGDKAEHFNKLAAPDRLKTITAEIGKYQGAIEEYKKSFDGISSTFRDNAKQFLGAATAPIFDRMKESLGRANDWLEKHHDKVNAIAAAIGDKLGRAWDWIAAKVEKLGPLVAGLFGGGGEAHGASGGGLGLAGAALGPVLGALLGATGPLVPVLGLLAAGFSAVMDKASALHADAVRAWSGIKSGFDALMPSINSLLGNVGKLAETLGVLLLNAINDVLPAATALIDALGFVVEAFAWAAKGIEPLVSSLMKLVTLGGGGGIDPEAIKRQREEQRRYDLMSADTLGQKKLAASVITGWSGVIAGDDGGGRPGDVVPQQWNYEAIDQMIARYSQRGHVDQEALNLLADKLFQPLYDRNHQDPLLQRGWQGPKQDPSAQRPGVPTGGGGGGGGVHIHRVEITVSGNQDPNRIARVIGGHLSDMSRFRKSSPYVPNFSANR